MAGGRNIGSGRSPLLPGNKWEGLFLAACQDTEMQTGVLLRIRRGTCLFHWHLDNECVYMNNEMLVTVKNQLIIKTQQEDFKP